MLSEEFAFKNRGKRQFVGLKQVQRKKPVLHSRKFLCDNLWWSSENSFFLSNHRTMDTNFSDSSTMTDTTPLNNDTTPYMGIFGFGEIEKYDQFIVSRYLNICGLWILTIIGLVCNTLAFLAIVLIKPFSTSSFYVALLAVLDTLVLVMRLLFEQLTGYDVPMSDAGCAIFIFLGNFVLYLSTWTLVTMTIERFVAVWFPLRVSKLFTMRRAMMSIIIISFILILLNVHFLWMTHEFIHPFPPVSRDCVFRPEYEEFGHNVSYEMVSSCLFAFMPCTSLIVLNAMIIYRMNKSFKMQKQMTNGEHCSASSKLYQHRQITIMLVTVSLFFAIFLLPICIFYLVEVKPLREHKSITEETARFYLKKEVVFFLAEMHHAINFLLYVLTSRKFRKMMIRLVTCNYRRKLTLDRYTNRNRLEQQ